MKAEVLLITILFLSINVFGQETTEEKKENLKSQGFVKSQKVNENNEGSKEAVIEISKPDQLNPTLKTRGSNKVKNTDSSNEIRSNSESGEINREVNYTSISKAQTIKNSAEFDSNQLSSEKTQLCVELGLDPLTASSADVKAAMRELYLNNPDKFQELNSNYFEKKSSKPAEINRSTYNNLSNERKSLIDNHPEKYKIID